MSILLPICSICHICCIFNDLRFGYSEKETKQTTRLCGRDHFGWRQVQPRHANLRTRQVRSPKLFVRGRFRVASCPFNRNVEGTHIPVVAGIWPLVSARNAEFLANEVPGVTVPAEVIDRMRRANEKSKEHAVAEGIAIAREMLARVRGAVQGVQVSAPFGKVELALEVFRA